MLRYCRQCGIKTDRYPNGRCKPCKSRHSRKYYRGHRTARLAQQANWRARQRGDTAWLDTAEKCPTCGHALPKRRKVT